ncbi:MAG: hypothetical protein J5529_02185 [Prevotella sp.]|nr:hypothetical protein [Prevotella sp.]
MAKLIKKIEMTIFFWEKRLCFILRITNMSFLSLYQTAWESKQNVFCLLSARHLQLCWCEDRWCLRLLLSLASPKIGCGSEMQNKKLRLIFLHSARLLLSLASPKIGCGSEMQNKKLRLLFCISLTLHYLCNTLPNHHRYGNLHQHRKRGLPQSPQ